MLAIGSGGNHNIEVQATGRSLCGVSLGVGAHVRCKVRCEFLRFGAAHLRQQDPAQLGLIVYFLVFLEKLHSLPQSRQRIQSGNFGAQFAVAILPRQVVATHQSHYIWIHHAEDHDLPGIALFEYIGLLVVRAPLRGPRAVCKTSRRQEERPGHGEANASRQLFRIRGGRIQTQTIVGVGQKWGREVVDQVVLFLLRIFLLIAPRRRRPSGIIEGRADIGIDALFPGRNKSVRVV